LINSQEIQSHLQRKKSTRKCVSHKRNPLKNLGFLVKLNPYAKVERKKTIEDAKSAKKRRTELREQRKKAQDARKAGKKSEKAPSKKEGKQTQAKKGKDAKAYRDLFVKTLLS
jgi:large subunit ribosomal protein L4e